MDGETITYDGIGNPTEYYNGYDYTFTWEHGRQLQSAATGGATTYYQYNADGIRTQKQTGDLVTEYFLVDGKAIGEVVRDQWGYCFYWLRYTFDENGQIIGFGRWVLGDTAWTEYYFAKNLQGDVIGVYRVSDNEQVAEYQYDAWGNIIYKSGDLADINPFRYRTYYYDNETWFYYLQSRYYDPAIGRFINADVLITTKSAGLGCNVFSYCLNNPLNYTDITGTDAIWIQEWNSAEHQGHTGLMVQDEEGVWYYFYWGPTPADEAEADVIKLCMGVANGAFYVPYKGEISQATTYDTTWVIETVNKISTDYELPNRSEAITNTLYFEGDFSKTHDYLSKLFDESGNCNQQYNLLSNNCVQQSKYALAQSDSRFTSIKLSPYPLMNLLLAVHPNLNYLKYKIKSEICWR